MRDVTEQEAIEKFTEGLSQASSCLKLMCHPWLHPEEKKKFAKAMVDASGSANQLAVMQQNPVFFSIRDQLEVMTKVVSDMAISLQFKEVRPQQTRAAFNQISVVLKTIAEKGRTLAHSKPLARADALAMMEDKRIIAAAKSDEEQARKKGMN